MNEFERKRVIKARTRLMLSSPFFASLVLRLRMVEDTNIPTAATDGVRMLYNPAFTATLSDQELQFVVGHEVLHCACLHPMRRGWRDPILANIAMDLVVNPVLVEAKCGSMPKGCLLDDRFKDMYFEQVYELLKKNVQQWVDKNGKGKGMSIGDVIDPQGSDAEGNSTGKRATQTERQMLEEDWKVASAQAALNAKNAGNVPGAIERMITEAQRSKVDWRALLRPFVQSSMDPRNYRWSPPNRRFVWQGLFLPSIEKEGIGGLDVHVDVSGSIDQDTLNQWASELQSIMQEARPEYLRVLYFDCALQGEPEMYGPDDTIILKARGGGGTDLRPSFDYVEKHGPQPICAVILTDLEIAGYPPEPDYPCMFATPNDNVAPFGTTVKIEAN